MYLMLTFGTTDSTDHFIDYSSIFFFKKKCKNSKFFLQLSCFLWSAVSWKKIRYLPKYLASNLCCWKNHSWNLDTCDFYINSTHVVKINFMRYLPKLHWFLGFYLIKMHEVILVHEAYSIFLYASLIVCLLHRCQENICIHA